MAGHFIWYELITSDLDAAIGFYSGVAGWNVVAGETPGMDYRHIHAGPDQIGGMMALPDGAQTAGMQPGWLGYVNVPDVDAEVSAFEAAGGKVAWPANDIPNVGRMAMVADPQGALVYVMAPSGQGQSQAYSPGVDGAMT